MVVPCGFVMGPHCLIVVPLLLRNSPYCFVVALWWVYIASWWVPIALWWSSWPQGGPQLFRMVVHLLGVVPIALAWSPLPQGPLSPCGDALSLCGGFPPPPGGPHCFVVVPMASWESPHGGAHLLPMIPITSRDPCFPLGPVSPQQPRLAPSRQSRDSHCPPRGPGGSGFWAADVASWCPPLTIFP